MANPYLHGDLESEILSRVPAKSLAKLQTTCKRWYSLLKDPKFAKKNQRKSAREVMLLMNLRVYSLSVNLHGIQTSVEFRGKLSTLKDSEDVKISELYYYDGLILCVTKGNTRLVVWNPCTGETRWIEPRIWNKPRSVFYDLYALGYGNSDSSYKILRFCYYRDAENRRVAQFEIYDFSSDSWRVLDGYTDEWYVSSSGVSLKGKTYWVAFDKETGFFLLGFDFTTERFGRLSLPYQSHNHEDTAVLSVVNDERLSVLYQDILAFSNVMKIWVTNEIVDGKDMSWRSFLVVDYDKFMLPSVTNVVSFLLDEENKVAVCCDNYEEDENLVGGERTRIYVVGEDIYKEVYKDTAKGGTFMNRSLLLSYVPSLLHITQKAKGGRGGKPSS